MMTAPRLRPLAYVEAGVLASIISCDGSWCRISVGGFRGYIEQIKLWGAYQGEVINPLSCVYRRPPQAARSVV